MIIDGVGIELNDEGSKVIDTRGDVWQLSLEQTRELFDRLPDTSDHFACGNGEGADEKPIDHLFF